MQGHGQVERAAKIVNVPQATANKIYESKVFNLETLFESGCDPASIHAPRSPSSSWIPKARPMARPFPALILSQVRHLPPTRDDVVHRQRWRLHHSASEQGVETGADVCVQ